jgi:hypothetical protein
MVVAHDRDAPALTNLLHCRPSAPPITNLTYYLKSVRGAIVTPPRLIHLAVEI